MIVREKSKVSDMTELMEATENQDISSINTILEHKTIQFINLGDSDGETALAKAAKLGNHQIVLKLLNAGAQLSYVDQKEVSALQKAVRASIYVADKSKQEDYQRTINLLLKNGEEADYKYGKGVESALDIVKNVLHRFEQNKNTQNHFEYLTQIKYSLENTQSKRSESL